MVFTRIYTPHGTYTGDNIETVRSNYDVDTRTKSHRGRAITPRIPHDSEITIHLIQLQCQFRRSFRGSR